MGDNVENNWLKKPRDINLPFFAYSIFKPGQIAYSKIKDCVEDKTETKISYAMKHRDGVPILIPKEDEWERTCGYVFNFNDNRKAYQIICQTISKNLYRWGTIDIGQEKVNVLFGLKPRNGSNYIEDPRDRENYDGQNDPLFKEGILLIKHNLESENYHWETGFFTLQMNYMLLWSAIDRYCKLRYNMPSEHQNREELSNENIFKEALKKYADSSKYRVIYTTDDLSSKKFDLENPKYCLNYFYTLRCNIVHRGKTSFRDVQLLEQATRDLLNIFEYILEDTFNVNEIK